MRLVSASLGGTLQERGFAGRGSDRRNEALANGSAAQMHRAGRVASVASEPKVTAEEARKAAHLRQGDLSPGPIGRQGWQAEPGGSHGKAARENGEMPES